MFGNKKFSGIDLHDHYISTATIKLERGFPVLVDVHKQETGKDLIVGGRVSQMDSITSVLGENIKSGTLAKEVHLAIPTQNILIRKVTSLPDIGESELRKLLHFEVGESIHLPFENPIYDFVKIGSIIPKTVEKNEELEGNEDELFLDELAKGIEQEMEGPKSELLLFATSKALAQDLVDVCTTAGLKPMSAEIRGLALQRLFLYVHPRWLAETEMIVDVSKESVDIHIFKDGVIVFSRMMSISQNDQFLAVENNLDQDVLLFEEELNQYMGEQEDYNQTAAARETTPIWNENSYINEIVLEVERAQNFFRYSLDQRESEFKRIIVTGECADQVYEPLIGRLEVEEIVRIDFRSILAPDFANSDLLDSCSVAIGLALRANETTKKK
jgi:type IV pilus assembly protein PilM